MSSIKPKQGYCITCNDGTLKPITAKRCNLHYWQYRASLKPPKEALKQVPIPKVSDKMSKLLTAQGALKKVWIKQNPICKVQVKCSGDPTQDIHHMRGRIGEDLNNTMYWLPVCRACHIFLGDNHKEAIERGFSLPRNQNPKP